MAHKILRSALSFLKCKDKDSNGDWDLFRDDHLKNLILQVDIYQFQNSPTIYLQIPNLCVTMKFSDSHSDRTSSREPVFPLT